MHANQQPNDPTSHAAGLAAAGAAADAAQAVEHIDIRNDAANDPSQAELELPQPGTAVASAASAQQAEAAPSGPAALLASRTLGQPVPLEVCCSAGGFYLGTYVEREPYSRESVQYWSTRQAAESALASGRWTQRQEP